MSELFMDTIQQKYESCLSSLEANYTGFFFYPFNIEDETIVLLHEYTKITLTFKDMNPVTHIIITNHANTLKIDQRECQFNGTKQGLKKAIEFLLKYK